MANTRKTSPAAKKRKTDSNARLNVTLRSRNGGDGKTLVPHDNLPIDDGSSTEEEDNTELEDEFLNKMVDDTDRPRETVFGPGVAIWKSHNGNVYVDLDDKFKSEMREMREKAIWTEEAKAKVHVGSKRKAADLTKSFGDGDAEDVIKKHTKAKGKAKAPKPKPNKTVQAYPDRSPTDTMYHRSSAGIDPLGALNRPFKPLPKRANAKASVLSGLGRVGMEASPSLSPPPTWAYREPAAGESFESHGSSF